MGDVLIPFVNYFVVLDGDGGRLLAKYYDGKSKPDQTKWEATLHKKTKTITTKTDGYSHLSNYHLFTSFRSGNYAT